jgi:hypothetical protein
LAAITPGIDPGPQIDTEALKVERLEGLVSLKNKANEQARGLPLGIKDRNPTRTAQHVPLLSSAIHGGSGAGAGYSSSREGG